MAEIGFKTLQQCMATVSGRAKPILQSAVRASAPSPASGSYYAPAYGGFSSPSYLGDEEKDVGGFGGVDGSLTKEAAACCVESGFATRTCRRTITQAHRYARSLVEGPERIAVQHVAVASLPADVARAVCAGGEHPLAL